MSPGGATQELWLPAPVELADSPPSRVPREGPISDVQTIDMQPHESLSENHPTESSHPAVQFTSGAQLCPTLCDPMNCSAPGLPVHHQLLSLSKLMSIESVMPSNHLSLCHPLLLPSSILPSIRVFSPESILHIRWPKYWSFSFSIIPSKEHPGLIPFRMDWLDLLAVQGTLKSLLQHHSSKASILWCSAFFIVQL